MAALAVKPAMQHPHRPKKPSPTSTDVKRAANMYMNKLTDRDTEAMAAMELNSMARSLPTDSIPSFLSAISDTRSSDKTPLRRHCVRLLSLLSQSHSPQSLSPLLPRMISAVRSRLRDPDSSVRAACVDAVRAISESVASSSSASSAVVFRPLCESLLLEQDHNAQISSAMCLAAAVEALGSEIFTDLQRLVPRLMKLAGSEAFKAKPALLALFGSVIVSGGASTLGALVPCLIGFLGSEDWATRKAAVDALARVAAIPDVHLLANFKASCVSAYECRRFDKVKIVRESMNKMVEAWKNVPDAEMDADDVGGLVDSYAKENADCGHHPAGSRMSSSAKSNNYSATTNRLTSSKSPPPEASPVRSVTRKNPSLSSARRTSSHMFQKNGNNKYSNWKIEKSTSQTPADDDACEDKQTVHLNNSRSHLEPKQFVFEDKTEDKISKSSNLKEAVLVNNLTQEKDPSLYATETSHITEELYIFQKENNEMSLIRNQLAHIENQQSNLMDLLQKFIGTSQNGLHSLETRVHGLEMTLDEISQNMAISSGTTSTPPATACCNLPGADFLSTKFWKRTEGRYSSRLSLSGPSELSGARNLSNKESMKSLTYDRQRRGIHGKFIVNPLAETNHPSGCSNAGSNRLPKNAMGDPGRKSAQEGSRYSNNLPYYVCESLDPPRYRNKMEIEQVFQSSAERNSLKQHDILP